MRIAPARPKRQSNEMLQLVISCCGGLGLLAGFLPTFAAGPVGLTLLGFTLLAAGLHVMVVRRTGRSIGQALLAVLVWGALAFGLAYGCIWYFTVYLASQPNILQFR